MAALIQVLLPQLKDSEYYCTGVIMKLYENSNLKVSTEHSCCTTDDIDDAKKVAEKLGIEHQVVDFSERFSKAVIDNFVNCYNFQQQENP